MTENPWWTSGGGWLASGSGPHSFCNGVLWKARVILNGLVWSVKVMNKDCAGGGCDLSVLAGDDSYEV